MKLIKQNYTKEFIEQRIADQRAYIAKLEQKPNRDEVWESANDTLIMWVLKLKDYEQRNTMSIESYKHWIIGLLIIEIDKGVMRDKERAKEFVKIAEDIIDFGNRHNLLK